MHTTIVGRPVEELDTPSLLIDLNAMERNIARVGGDLRANGVAWRPHAKAHKCPAIAHKQLAAGAIGITCAKLGEAEVFAAAGVRDILIANQIVGPIKARRLAALCAHADVIVAVDSVENMRELDAAARAHGTRPRAVVEVNTGMDRCGVAPGEETVSISQSIVACEGLRYAGLMAWEGHTMAMSDPATRVPAIKEAVTLLTESAAACRDAGLTVEIVSCGGSGTYMVAGAMPGVTEVEAGGGIFGDAMYRDFGVEVEPALTLLVQVVSRAAPERIVVDAGRKSIDPTAREPEVRGLAEVVSFRCSAEHGTITLGHASATPRVGDRLELEVGYSDQVVHLHEYLYGVRNGVVETVWPVAARGKLQ